MNERERAVLAAIDDDETLMLLHDLVSTPSENPPGGEQACAELVAARLEPAATRCRVVEILPGRPNVLASLGAPDDGGPVLVFNGHLDTVPAGDGWTVDPFGAEVRDGRMYGRGAGDMKAGVTAMCAAFLAVARAGIPLRGRLDVHAVADEEDLARGSRRAAVEEPADLVIVTEASRGDVLTFGNGQLNLEIAFTGQAVHSSRPEAGRNAIHDAAAFVALVEEEHARLAADVFPGLGPGTFSVGLIAGGLGGTIVADHCALTLDRRVLPSETLDDAEAGVVALLERLARERPGLAWTMERTLAFPPLTAGPGTDALATAVADAAEAVGAPRRPQPAGIRAATDAAWYAGAGKSVVIYGPGDGATAHQPDEWVDVAEILRVARVLALTAARMLDPDAPA